MSVENRLKRGQVFQRRKISVEAAVITQTRYDQARELAEERVRHSLIPKIRLR